MRALWCVILSTFLSICSHAGGFKPIDLTPAECRQRCAQHPDSGWCLHLNNRATGIRPAIDPFITLIEAAKAPQTFQYNGQTVLVTADTLVMRGPRHSIERNDMLGKVIRTKLPGRTRGAITKAASDALELVFKKGLPTWFIDSLSPPIGENQVRFITEGRTYEGNPNVIWFDRYFCWSAEKI